MYLKQKIVIVDYGVGNIRSVFNSISTLGYKKLKVSSTQKDLSDADMLILPGVGAFDEAIRNITSRNLIPLLNEQVIQLKKPILGICVGMQLLTDGSEENGWHDGLGWIPGRIEKIKIKKGFHVPHVGWNNIKFDQTCILSSNLGEEKHFYFDHSYSYEGDEKYVCASCEYGGKINSVIQLNNIFGVQFHPEKSQTNGLKLFRNFFNNLSERC